MHDTTRPTVRSRFWLTAALLLILNTAGWIWIAGLIRERRVHAADPPLRVTRVVPAGPAQDADQLWVEFDRYVGAGKLGEVLDAAPFVFDPPLQGSWTWESGNRLAFALDVPLRAGFVYSATPTPRFEEVMGAPLDPVDRPAWTTRGLEVRDVLVHEAGLHKVVVELRFSEAVHPDALREHLTLRDSETQRELKHQVLGDSRATRRVRVELDRSAAKIIVEVDEGLLAEGRAIGLAKATQHTLLVPDPATLSVLQRSVDVAQYSASSTIELRFDRSLAMGQDLAGVTLDPPVKDLRVDVSGRQLRLTGELECRRSYRVRLPGTLVGTDGVTLAAAQEIEVAVGGRRPALWMPSGGVLGAHGNLEILFGACNVDRVRLSAWRVHENNLVEHASGRGPHRTSASVMMRIVDIGGTPDVPEVHALDLSGLLGENPLGTYRVEVEDLNSGWRSDYAVVRISDLGMTVKLGANSAFVWVHGLSDAQAKEGATVRLYTRTDQRLAVGRTGPDGTVVLPLPKELPEGGPVLATVELDGDLNWLEPDERHWVLEGASANGRAWPGDLDVAAWTERDLHQPGENVNVLALGRDREGRVVPRSELTAKLTGPDARTVSTATFHLEPGAQGFGRVELPSDGLGATGVHHVEIHATGGQRVARIPVLVEPFVPARIEVESSIVGEEDGLRRFTQQDPAPRVRVTTRYLVGRAASDLAVKARTTWRTIAFHADGLEGYRFPSTARTERSKHESTATTDAEGDATIDVMVPMLAPGLWRATVASTVTEHGGRSVSRTSAFEWDGAGRHFGLSVGSDDSDVVALDAAELSWVHVDSTGIDLADPAAELELWRVRHEWERVHRDGRVRWTREERLERVAGRPTKEARGVWDMPLTESGTYRVIGRDPATKLETRVDFYAAGFGDQRVTRATDGPDRVTLQLESDRLEPGATLRVRVLSPFLGTALVTIESDEVCAHHVVAITAEEQWVELPVPTDLVGGGTVIASVVRGIDPDAVDWQPHRARGGAHFLTTHTDRNLDIALDVPATARPGERVMVTAQIPAGDPARIQLWAVDRGILQAGAYQAPDPFAHYLGARRHAVDTVDLYDELVVDVQRPEGMRRIGGDASALELRRGPAKLERRVSAIVTGIGADTDDTGRATFDVTLPDFRGSLRWFAVAARETSFGSASTDGTVDTPVGLRLTLPRVVAPGDRFDGTLEVTNGTDQPVRLVAELERTGPLGCQVDEEPFELAPGAVRVLSVPALAEADGEVAVRVRVTGEGIDETARANLLVRAALPPVSRVDLITLGDEPVALDPREGFASDAGIVRVRVAGEALDLEPALQALIQYPFGCAEQTSSRMLALLALQRKDALDEAQIDRGIRHLASMRTPDGGMAYWAGGRLPNVWITAQVALILDRASENGHTVGAAWLDAMANFLHGQLGLDVDDATRCISVHALAALDRPHEGWTARLTDRQNDLDRGARAHLIQAWMEIGRPERALALLASDPIGAPATFANAGRLTSPTVQDARLLQAWIACAPNDPELQRLVERIEAARDQGRWRNTLEDALALTALAAARDLRESTGPWIGTLQLPDGRSIALDGATAFDRTFDMTELGGALTFEGSGGSGTAWIERMGTPLATADPAKDEHLVVRRRYLDVNGEPIAGRPVSVGDLIQVEVLLEAQGAPGSIPNLAIVDLLPGGFEVENPRLSTSQALPQRGETSRAVEASTNGEIRWHGLKVASPDRVEFREDRVLIFGRATAEPSVVRYSLRAVTPGVFAVPPIQGSSMYDPSIESVHGSGVVEVVR
tara:strand:- start:1836 stop:7202 length:5367 start_codon:yes stop_codon:yes gene_type:complete